MQPRLVAAAVVLLTMIPAAVSVREGPNSRLRWWHVASMQRQLQLTSAQIASLDALFEQGLLERIHRHRQIQEIDVRLTRIMAEANPADDRVAALSQQVEALRARRNIRRTLMLFEMYQVLTHQQRMMLTEIHRSGYGSPLRPGDQR